MSVSHLCLKSGLTGFRLKHRHFFPSKFRSNTKNATKLHLQALFSSVFDSQLGPLQMHLTNQSLSHYLRCFLGALALHPGCNGDDVLGTNSFTASAEGRVEHQTLNQTAP